MADPAAPSRVAERLDTLDEVVAAVPGIVFAYLFGSYSTGRAGPLSDVDVAVYLGEGVDELDTRLLVLDMVSRHLGTDRVDVVVLNSAPLALAGRVLLTRRVIAEQDAFARHRYESSIGRQFADFLLFERRHLARRYGRVDRELVLRKAAQLEQCVNEPQGCRAVTVDAYASDLRTQRFVERTLHLAVEACLDLAEHVIADRRLRVPASHAETFEILREAGFIADPLADSLVRMARFRNVLVHDDARIDAARVVRILQENLDDLTAFKDVVVQSV